MGVAGGVGHHSLGAKRLQCACSPRHCCLFACLPTCLPTCLPAFLPTFLPTHLPLLALPLSQAAEDAGEPLPTDDDEVRDFIVLSLDMLSAMCEALGKGVAALMGKSNVLTLVHACMAVSVRRCAPSRRTHAHVHWLRWPLKRHSRHFPLPSPSVCSHDSLLVRLHCTGLQR